MDPSRIAKEHADIQRNPLETGYAGPVKGGDPRQWFGHIIGPPDTPYAQGNHSVAIVFPESYPRIPFKLTFTTPIFHPNVSENGEVRLAELDEKNWSPVLTVRSVLICLQALLSDPEPLEGVLNSEAATMYLTNKEKFKEKASQWNRPK